MKLEGKLNLHNKTCEYIMFSEGRLTNISKMLDIMLLYDVKVKVTDLYTTEVLFNEKGQLIREKFGKLYLYHVNGQNLDDILWNNVGNRLRIEMKNITKE